MSICGNTNTMLFAADEFKQMRGAAGTKASPCYVRYEDIALNAWPISVAIWVCN